MLPIASVARILVLAIALSLASVSTALAASDEPGMTVIGTIDGEPVTAAEARQAFSAERAGTYAYFHTQGLESGADFWTTAKKGQTPLQYLREHALARLVRLRIQETFLRSEGVWPIASYAAFLAQFREENERRRMALAHGDVVYGPREYTESGYFSYLLSNAINHLKTKLVEKKWHTTEQDLQNYYESTKGRRYNRGAWVEVDQIKIVYRKGEKEAAKMDQSIAKQRIFTAVQQIEDGADFLAVAKVLDGQGTPAHFRYTEDDQKVGKLEQDPVVTAALRLKPGQQSGLVEGWNEYALFRCTARGDTDFVPFEECRSDLAQRWVDKCYAEWLEDAANHAKVDLQQGAWNALQPDS